MCRPCGILVGTQCNVTVETHLVLCILDSAQMVIRFSPLYSRLLLWYTTVDVLVLLGPVLLFLVNLLLIRLH